MTVRLADIAARAGVSEATVSRVLNDKPGVNELTRRSVLTAVDVLGYDRPARLRQKTSGLVGLVVPELENPFFPRLVLALERFLVQRAYTPMLCTQWLGGVPEDVYVDALLEHGVCGIIFVSGVHAIAASSPDRYLRLTELGMPLVQVNGHLAGVPAASVATDDLAAMDLAVAHLADRGHREIGLITGQQRYTPVQRKILGFGAAIRRHVDPGLDDSWLASHVESTYYTVEGGTVAALPLLAADVTAVVCASDVMALGVLTAARQRGLRVPEDLSVVGCDDSLVMAFTDPPLTTVRQPVPALAEAAVRLLLDGIGGAPPPPDELLLKPELVVRGSTARVPSVRADRQENRP